MSQAGVGIAMKRQAQRAWLQPALARARVCSAGDRELMGGVAIVAARQQSCVRLPSLADDANGAPFPAEPRSQLLGRADGDHDAKHFRLAGRPQLLISGHALQKKKGKK